MVTQPPFPSCSEPTEGREREGPGTSDAVLGHERSAPAMGLLFSEEWSHSSSWLSLASTANIAVHLRQNPDSVIDDEWKLSIWQMEPELTMGEREGTAGGREGDAITKHKTTQRWKNDDLKKKTIRLKDSSAETQKWCGCGGSCHPGIDKLHRRPCDVTVMLINLWNV